MTARELNFLLRADGELGRLTIEAGEQGQAALAFLLDLARREIQDEMRCLRQRLEGGREGGLRLVASAPLPVSPKRSRTAALRSVL